jgi:ParB-like chromosome segregation protein Spo0J
MSIEYHCRYDELVSPDDLKRHPKNAKMHPEEQIEALCRFIRVSGWRQVVTVSNRSGFVVAGNARTVAARSLGCAAPVVYQDFESEADEVAYLLADNRLAELATTDDDILQTNLEFLNGAGFELETIGFELEIENDHVFDPETSGEEDEESRSSESLSSVRVLMTDAVRGRVMKSLMDLQKEIGADNISWKI